MNYKVLYRKYRPDCFKKIVGQDYIIQTLKNSIINNTISHAYIFSGPRGTGKTSTAKVFAKAINCLNPVDGSPCGKCDFCKNYEDNPDIIEMDAASNNGVDEIREIIDNVKLTPTNGKYKVYIIDEVHMLTTSAFNALLLTLEEPPAHVVFILATTNVENVPITILSRCQRFDFQKISLNDLTQNLKNICSLEKIKIDDDAIDEISYLSEGGMRDALSLLDQLSKSGDKITLEFIEKHIKTISRSSINGLIDDIEDNNIDSFLNKICEYKSRNVEYKSFLKKLIECLSNRAVNIKTRGKIQRLNYTNYKDLILKLSECFVKININVEPYTIIELIILEFFDTKTSIDTVEKDIKQPEKKKEDINFINVRINNCFVDAKKESLIAAQNMVNDIINSQGVDGKVKSLLMDSKVVAASNEYIVFSCQDEHFAITANDKIKLIENAINKLRNTSYKIVFIAEEKWLILKNEYITNLKKGIKYEHIKEQDAEEPIINDVFDISKIEIV